MYYYMSNKFTELNWFNRQMKRINPLTAGAAHIRVFIFD